MAITSLAQLNAAPKQTLFWRKNLATVVANAPRTVFDQAGQPAAGVLSGGQSGASLNPGNIPTQATPGYPSIREFPGGTQGYISNITASINVPTGSTSGDDIVLYLFDRLWVSGPWTQAQSGTDFAAVSPSYDSRLPRIPGTSNPDYSTAELWAEHFLTTSGVIEFTRVQYNNELGQTGRFTPTLTISNRTSVITACAPFALQAGDKGVSGVTAAQTNGAFVSSGNVMILRRLTAIRIPRDKVSVTATANDIGLVEIFPNTALYVLAWGANQAILAYLQIQVAMG